MTVAMWALLGFAAWTIVLLLFTVGVYRWSRILTGRVQDRVRSLIYDTAFASLAVLLEQARYNYGQTP